MFNIFNKAKVADLEARVLLLENKIAVMEKQNALSAAAKTGKAASKKGKDAPKTEKDAPKAENTAPKAENTAPKAENTAPKAENAEPNKKNINPKIKKHIQSIMQKTGWTYDATVNHVKLARQKIGITYGNYDLYNFHEVALEEQVTKYKEFLKNQKIKDKKARVARKQEVLILTVIENTGWDYKTAKQNMNKARSLCGAEYKDYVAYEFWTLDEAVQATYFTKGHANTLRKKYNTNKENINCFMNKNQFNETFAEFLGRPWADTEKVSLEEFKSTFEQEKRIIYKPLSDSCGHGVTVFDLTEDNLESVYNKIVALPKGVVEGYVVQHPAMSRYSRNSVNTVRLVSVYAFGEVNVLYAAFRMGGGDSVVDNFHAGGVLALIDTETGVVNTEAIDLAAKPYAYHPVTNEKIVGFQIPYWNEIVELIRKAGKVVDGVGYVGWDIAVTENGPILIEGNTAPAPNVLQTPYAKQHRGMKHVIEKYL